MKKLMTSQQMIEFLPPTEETTAEACGILGRVCPEIKKAELDYSVAEGFCKVKAIWINGVRSFFIWYYVDCFKNLQVNAVASLLDHDATDDCMIATEVLARAESCDKIVFKTARRGMVTVAQRRGFVVEYVSMVKEVPRG